MTLFASYHIYANKRHIIKAETCKKITAKIRKLEYLAVYGRASMGES